MVLRSVPLFFGALLSLLFVFGCHTPLAMKQIQARNPLAKNAVKMPTEIVDVWNSFAQTTPDGKTMRGLGGRIHFFDNQKKSQAVKVDGDITVFVFDGNETDPTRTKPLKVFKFAAETLNDHYKHEKPLGHGYSFFLPIDEVGGKEMPICVMVRFDNKLEDTFATTPLLKPTHTILAGRKPQPADPTIRDYLESRSLLAENSRTMIASYDSAIQQAGYVTESPKSEPEPAPAKTNVLKTIPLNSDMTRRLLEAKP